MKPRTRVLTALAHREPDRVPLGGAFKPEVLPRYVEYFGLPASSTVDTEQVDRVRERFGIDTRTIDMDPPTGFQARGTQRKPNSRDYGWYLVDIDEFGIGREWSSTGVHWHFTCHPLQHVALDEFAFPDIDAPGRWERARRDVRRYRGDYLVWGGAGVGLYEQAWYLRGFRRFIRDLYTNPSYVDRLLDRLLAWKIERGKRCIELGAEVATFGDDLGNNLGLTITPAQFRRFFKPRYKKMFDAFRKQGAAYIDFHSDGKIDAIIPDLLEVGVDIINPVQPDCMDLPELKRRYGAQLCFHGCISVQETMPFGTRDDVETEVITRIRTMGPGGGLILSPRLVQVDVPVANLVAFYDAAKKHGTYPIAIPA